MSVEGRCRARWGAPESSAADLRAAAARAGRVTATHRPSNAIPREDHAARERGFSTCVTVDYRGGRAAGPSSANKATHDTRARASPASSRRTWRVVDPVNATTREPEPGRERDVRRTDARDEHPDDFESPDEDDEDEEEKTRLSSTAAASCLARASTIPRPPLSPTIPNRGVPPPSRELDRRLSRGAAGTRAPRRRAGW